MWRILDARWRQGRRTSGYPATAPSLPDRFRGLPVLDADRCAASDGCRACVDACPTDALSAGAGGLALDLGKCLFCRECETGCPEGAVRFTTGHRLAARRREDLLLRDALPRVKALDASMLRVFRRSLRLRQVSAGGCGGCEADVNVLGTVVFDLSRFGVQLVASPRHADGLLITGVISDNMKLAVEKAYAALPEPRIVIAVGACAISGGPFMGNPEGHDGAQSVVPVDLFVPGCPPHPFTILDGLLALLDRL